MKNGNLLAAVVRDPTTRVTRARAAASQSSEGLHILDASKQQLQRRELRKNSKRVALDEKSSCAPTNQHKRRAVLKDVTNICCDDSYRNCLNATKPTVLDSSSDFVPFVQRYMRSEHAPLSSLYISFLCNCLRRYRV